MLEFKKSCWVFKCRLYFNPINNCEILCTPLYYSNSFLLWPWPLTDDLDLRTWPIAILSDLDVTNLIINKNQLIMS